jgi:DNA-binding beta-propeller fold protein YncE
LKDDAVTGELDAGPPETIVAGPPAPAAMPQHVVAAAAPPLPEPAANAALDRAIEVHGLSWWAPAWAVALVAAVALRLGDLDRWALSTIEGQAAFDAWRMYTGNPGVAGDVLPDTRPFPLLLEALSFFLFGVTDATFRVPTAALGLLVLPLLWLLRPAAGAGAVASMALLVAVSPVLVHSARTADGQTIAAVVLLAAAVAIIRMGRLDAPASAIRRNAVLLGVSLAAAIGCGAGAIPSLAALAAGIAVAGMRPGIVRRGLARLREPGNAVATLAALLIALVVLFTRLFTAPEALAGLPRVFGDAFALMTQAGAGKLGIMALLMLLLYESVSVLMAVYGTVADWPAETDRSLPALLGGWLIAGLLLWGLAAGAGPEHEVHLALPLVLLGGLGLARLLEAIDWADVRSGRGLALLLAVLAASAAAFAVVVLLGRPPLGDNRLSVALPAVGVATLALVPLLYAITRLAAGQREAGLPRQAPRIALLALAMMLGAFGISSTTHLIYERAGLGTEPIAQRVSTGAVRPAVERLGRLARDTGITAGSVRDPEGSHSLRVAIDEQIAQPWRWYLRDFPFAEPAAAGTAGATAAQVVIEPASVPLASAYRDNRLPAVTGVPEVYTNPDLPDLLLRVIDPQDWLQDARFLHFREGVEVPPPAMVRVALNRELANRIEPESGPYSLDDRPGPGSAEGQFMQPVGIAVGRDGAIAVMDSGNARVERFDPDGEYAGTWESRNGVDLLRTDTGFGPTGMATGPDGNYYLADTWNHRILVVDPGGFVVREIGGPAGAMADIGDDPARVADDPGQFFGPRAIAVTRDAIYVSDTGNERIQVFEPDGTFRTAFGGYGTGRDNLIEPVGLAVGPDGDLYVADSGNQRVQVFSPRGRPQGSFIVDAWPEPDPSGLRPFFQPYLAFDDEGRLFVSSSASGTVEVYDPATGDLLGTLTGGGGDRFGQPVGLAFDAAGDLLVTDLGASAVIRVPSAELQLALPVLDEAATPVAE